MSKNFFLLFVLIVSCSLTSSNKLKLSQGGERFKSIKRNWREIAKDYKDLSDGEGERLTKAINDYFNVYTPDVYIKASNKIDEIIKIVQAYHAPTIEKLKTDHQREVLKTNLSDEQIKQEENLFNYNYKSAENIIKEQMKPFVDAKNALLKELTQIQTNIDVLRGDVSFYQNEFEKARIEAEKDFNVPEPKKAAQVQAWLNSAQFRENMKNAYIAEFNKPRFIYTKGVPIDIPNAEDSFACIVLKLTLKCKAKLESQKPQMWPYYIPDYLNEYYTIVN